MSLSKTSIAGFAQQDLDRLQHIWGGQVYFAERRTPDRAGNAPKSDHAWVGYRAYPNPDGSIRWLVPDSDRNADFLAFYNRATKRAKMLAAVWKTAAWLQWPVLNRILGIRRLWVRIPQEMRSSKRGRLTIGVPLFLGTAGTDRKALARIPASADKAAQFVKIALGERSTALLRNEASQLAWLKGFKSSFRYPTLSMMEEEGQLLVMDDVAPRDGNRVRHFGPAHARFVADLLSAPMPPALTDNGFWTALTEMAADLPQAPWAKAVRLLLDRLQEGPPLPMQVMHGDFTPWNCWMDARDGTLAVYDWELSRTAPALFDLFHFVVQGESLLGTHQHGEASVNRIDRLENLLAAAMGQPALDHIFAGGGTTQNGATPIDPERHLQAYLCWMLCYYGPAYAARMQAGQASYAETRLMQVWTTWIQRHAHACAPQTMRTRFLAQLGEHLTDAGIALLKHRHGPLVDLPRESDLDTLGPKTGVVQLLRRWDQHPDLAAIRIREAPGMINALLVFRDGDLLSLDFLHAFQRKGLIYARAEEALRQARFDPGIGCMVLPAAIDLEYLVAFYQLNGSGLPKSYLAWFKALPEAEQAAARTHLEACTGMKGFSPGLATEAGASWMAHWKKRVLRWPENRFWKRAWRSTMHLLRSLMDTFRERGFTVTLSGADGAGKSTILADLERTLRKRYRRKVVVLRHRPSVLPMLSAWKHGRQEAERRAAVRLPRQGTNRNRFSSLLRFAYYYSDYLLGQFYVWFRYVLRGYVVLYDRYYFDFIVDGKRSNLQLDPRLAFAGWRLLFKPRRNYFLYAPAAVIRKRKQELDLDAIGALNDGYLALFRKLSENGTNHPKQPRYTPVINLERERTLRRIIKDLKAPLRIPA